MYYYREEDSSPKQATNKSNQPISNKKTKKTDSSKKQQTSQQQDNEEDLDDIEMVGYYERVLWKISTNLDTNVILKWSIPCLLRVNSLCVNASIVCQNHMQNIYFFKSYSLTIIMWMECALTLKICVKLYTSITW